MNKKETMIDAIKHKYNQLNTKGRKEFKAWFIYYFGLEYSMINLLIEAQLNHCYVVIHDLAQRKEFQK